MMGLAEKHTTYLFGGPVSLAPEALRKMGSLEHLEDNDGWLRRSVGPVNLTLTGMGFAPRWYRGQPGRSMKILG
jgi:hypothetical protein